MVFLIVKTIVIDDEDLEFATPTVYVFACRFICSLLLHMELFEDVKQGQAMLLYLNLHTDEFDSTIIPYFIATMQHSAGLLAESANILMLATRSSVEYCITFFVAFHVLASIDNIYAEGLVHFKLKEAVEEPLQFKRDTKPYAENKTWVDKAIAF